MKKTLRLQQGQVWKAGGEFLRIVQLERLEVGYKSSRALPAQTGKHLTVTKKEFCRMLKGATLLGPDGTPPAPAQQPPVRPARLNPDAESGNRASL